MEPNSLPPQAVALLERGGTILTGNQRAARTLRLAFDRQARAGGRTSWQPPRIFAWDTWTAQLWQQALIAGTADKLLLNRSQELQLWRSIISADPQWASLQTTDSLANMAAGAWQLLCAYRGQSQLRSLGVSEDTRTFQRWAQAFIRRCKSDAYLSPSEIEHALASTKTQPSNELLLIGFDSKTPAQLALIESLQSAGVEVMDLPLYPTAEHRHIAISKDLDAELTEAALWLRAALESNPEARIAVIHPDIAAERLEIDRVFRRILAPELQSITAGPADGPFEFSLGQPLSQSPMVAIARKLLRWVTNPIPIEEISHLLLSPYFTPASELQSRAQFDAFELRRSILLRPELSLSGMLAQIESRSTSKCPPNLLSQLHSLNRTAAKLLPDSSKQKSHADWADTTRELLSASGWASTPREDTIEYQTRRKWESALDELTTLDFEGARITFPESLAHLESILQRTLFAPESREAPIQIMSPQEAAGSRFDALYFLRASDLNWPSTPGTNPMLGWRLQRELNMPGSDPTGDLAHPKAVTARLAASASTIVFSYARETADGHQRPSPLLADLALEPISAPAPPKAMAPIALEEIEDPGNIPLTDPKVRGGANVLKLQAACGFRAFAETRLNSRPLDTIEPGFDSLQRGNVVHDALDHLWRELRTHAALAALTSDQRSAQLHRSIDYSLRKFQGIAAIPWDAAYLEVQHERLHRLLSSWLDLELDRAPFEVKLREQDYEDVAIGPLLLSLRVDRVDTPADATPDTPTEIIIDYKTGVSHPSAWNSGRPDEPQLPLYAALREPNTVAAVAFAQLRPGVEMGLKGFAASEEILPRPLKLQHESLEAQIEEWHRILTSLAEDFFAGDARVRPKSYPITCSFCKQRLLCRLDPALLEDDLDDAEDSEEAKQERANG